MTTRTEGAFFDMDEQVAHQDEDCVETELEFSALSDLEPHESLKGLLPDDVEACEDCWE